MGQDVTLTIDQAIDIAKEHYQAGRLAASKSFCLQIIGVRSEQPGALNLLGMISLREDQREMASMYLNRAISAKPDFAEAHKNLGNVFLSQKMHDQAIKCYQQAIACDPAYYAPYNNLATISYTVGEIDQAIVYYKKTLEIRTNDSGVAHNLGSALYSSGDMSGAIDCFTRILGNPLDAWVADSAAFLAVLRFLRGDIRETQAIIDVYQNSQVIGSTKLHNYFRYLASLIAFSPASTNEQSEALHVIGESHSLSPHNTLITIDGKAMRCRSSWILGCKQWHLRSEDRNRFKPQFESILRSLPNGSSILLTVGEIDCRPDEGVIKVLHTKGGTVEGIIERTVSGYIDYVASQTTERDFKVIICGVPATNWDLSSLEADKAAQLVSVIRQFNERLKAHALAAGLDFLDVYRMTDRGDGISNKLWHLEETHLRPGAIAEAFKNHYIRAS
jgi:tetratricopeptide (TPR) repeat protein